MTRVVRSHGGDSGIFLMPLPVVIQWNIVPSGAASLRPLCSILRALPQLRPTTGMSTSTPTCTWLATTVATAMCAEALQAWADTATVIQEEDPSHVTPAPAFLPLPPNSLTLSSRREAWVPSSIPPFSH